MDITTQNHHVFSAALDDPGWLQAHLDMLERDGWRVVATAVADGDLIVTMAR